MIQDVSLFLKEHYPFSELPESSLEALSFHTTVRYLPKGEVIFKEGDKPLEHLFLIRKGVVSLQVEGKEIDLLHEGDCFGYPSLLSNEPPTATALVEEEVILYLIPKEVFLNLVKKYEAFENFFTRNLAKKLSATTSMLRISGESPSLESFFTLRLKDLRIRKIPILSPERNILEVAKLLKDRNISCVFVGRGEAEGIITERDIIKRVVALSKAPEETKLEEVASYPVISVESEDFVFEALLKMAKHNIRRLGVKEGGKLIGVIEDRDIIAYESKNLIVIIKEIEKAQSLEELRYIYSMYQDTVLQLFHSGVGVERISRLISEINDKIMSRVVFLTIRELGEEPPVNFSIMVLGSEGRREQTLKTDQDNALIYNDEIPMLDIDVGSYFDRFARLYTDSLLKIGFPPCPGKVMVNNPEWRHGISKWINILKNWINKPEPENTLRVGIFFDFRNAFGDGSLVERLREEVFNLAKNNELFVGYMILDAIRFKPPLGLFRGFLLERRGEHKGELDIKKGGIFPITQGIRALALKGGIAETGTRERIEKLTQMSLIPSDLSQDLMEAFKFLQEMRLKNQIQKLKEGKEPDNYINPDRLGKLERDLLKDAFKVVEEFQSFLDRRYTAYIPR